MIAMIKTPVFLVFLRFSYFFHFFLTSISTLKIHCTEGKTTPDFSYSTWFSNWLIYQINFQEIVELWSRLSCASRWQIVGASIRRLVAVILSALNHSTLTAETNWTMCSDYFPCEPFRTVKSWCLAQTSISLVILVLQCLPGFISFYWIRLCLLFCWVLQGLTWVDFVSRLI